jgi:hypothetical protein
MAKNSQSWPIQRKLWEGVTPEVRSWMGCFHAKTAKIMRRKGGKGLMVQGAYGVIKSHCESKSEAKCRQAPTLCLLCDELSLRTLREIYCAIFSHLQFVYLSQQFGRSHQVKHNETDFLVHADCDTGIRSNHHHRHCHR